MGHVQDQVYTQFPNRREKGIFMTSTVNTTPVNRILSVIKEKGSATFSEIKRAINEFHNKPGGAEQLRKHLTKIVSDGMVATHIDKSGKGRAVESYSIANSSTTGKSNSSNVRSNDNNVTISCTLAITIEGCTDIAHILTSFLNVDDGNCNECEVEAAIDDVEQSNPTVVPPVVEPLEDEPDGTLAPPTPSVPARRTAKPPARIDTPVCPRQDKTSPSNTSQSSRDIEDEDGEIDPDQIPF